LSNSIACLSPSSIVFSLQIKTNSRLNFQTAFLFYNSFKIKSSFFTPFFLFILPEEVSKIF